MNNEEKSFQKSGINCLTSIYLTPFTNLYKIRDCWKLDNAYFITKLLKKGKK